LLIAAATATVGAVRKPTPGSPNATRRFDAALFDLDGTLLDTLDDLADSMNAALAAAGYPGHDAAFYRLAVGEGVEVLVRRSLPEGRRDAESVAACVAAMRVEYGRRWDAKTRPYPGIAEAVGALRALGLRLAVLSNKPEDFTRRLVARMFAPGLFDDVWGALPDRPRKPDPAAALALARAAGIAPARWVYVGDTGTDMRTARAAGMFAAGVLWGFRDGRELRDHGADALVREPSGLVALADARP
jgi:phosphoglycolate phosphatase